jgi:hypothetical protein
MDRLSNSSLSTASSSLDRAASGATPASDAAPALGATSAALDDACKHNEDLLAELQPNPSVDAAVRFDNELKCPGCSRNFRLFEAIKPGRMSEPNNSAGA